METTVRKTQPVPHLASCSGGRPWPTEHWPCICLEEGSYSRRLAAHCGHSNAPAEYDIKEEEVQHSWLYSFRGCIIASFTFRYLHNAVKLSKYKDVNKKNLLCVVGIVAILCSYSEMASAFYLRLTSLLASDEQSAVFFYTAQFHTFTIAFQQSSFYELRSHILTYIICSFGNRIKCKNFESIHASKTQLCSKKINQGAIEVNQDLVN